MTQCPVCGAPLFPGLTSIAATNDWAGLTGSLLLRWEDGGLGHTPWECPFPCWASVFICQVGLCRTA